MKFTETPLRGAYLIDLEPRDDERGFFARAWCADEMRAHGLEPRIAQGNVSYNRRRGTLRGLHYQAPPHAETKVVRCVRGAVYDVIVDLRHGSPTFRQWFGETLTAENRRAMYVPEEFAHGFLTLQDDCEVFYMMSRAYAESAGRGVRWDDPAIAVRWPIAPEVISGRDASWPLLDQ